jgi:hypothetical protein
MDYPLVCEESPRVVLGGKHWPIPLLSARENKVIDPLILGLLPLFSLWERDKSAALERLGAAQYDALLEIALVAARRASPQLTREQFLDLPITLPELIAAFSVIAQQTGIFEKARPGGAAGEALAGKGEALAAPTGTGSSPMSAI